MSSRKPVAPRLQNDIDGPYKIGCGMCGEDKLITVRIEVEHGEFGSILSSWPEFDIEPDCLGFEETYDANGVLNSKKVTPGMDVVMPDRCRERCPFQSELDYINPVDFVLGMRSERKRALKAEQASL